MKKKFTIYVLKKFAKILHVISTILNLLSGILYYAFTGFGWLCLFGVVMECIFDRDLMDIVIYLGAGVVCFVLRWVICFIPAPILYAEESLNDRVENMEWADMFDQELEDNNTFR